MKFLRIKCKGCLNSFRQPDFHTYHKTLPLPPKTTIAGMLGSALGISPREVNEEWLKKDRFKAGVVGKSNGKANDLWQIRKFETKHIANYKKGTESAPYKTAVIVRELLYACEFIIYLHLTEENEFALIRKKLENPAWALSLGREDELIRINEIKLLDLQEQDNLYYANTILPFDININRYEVSLGDAGYGKNLLSKAPKTVKLPVTFSQKENSETRNADTFQMFTYVSDLPIKPNLASGYFDHEEQCSFQVF